MPSLRVAVAVLTLAATTISAEIPVSSIQFGPADHTQTEPLVATNGEIHLAVWVTMSLPAADIQAARISASGEVLDGVPITLSAGNRDAWPRLAAWTGRFFVVAIIDRSLGRGEVTRLVKIDSHGQIVGETIIEQMWPLALRCGSDRCLLTGVNAQPFQGHLEAMMLDLDLRALGERRMIAPLSGVVYADAATNGANFLVTWQDTDDSSPPRWILRATIVSLDGTPETPRELPAERSFLRTHAVTVSGTEYAVVWDERSSVLAHDRNSYVTYRLSGDGRAVGQPEKRPLPEGREAGLGFIPAEGGFLGFMNTDAPPHRVVMFEIAAGGELRRPPRELIRLSTGFGFRAAITRSEILMLSAESHATVDLYVRRFSRSGEPASGPTVVVESARAQRMPAMVWDGAHIVTVWEEVAGVRTEVRMSKMRSNAATELELTVPASASSQRLPAIGFNGSEYLVVWLESSPDGVALAGQRIGRGGTPIDSTPIVLTTRYCGERRPSVTSDGRDFLVAWTDCSDPVQRPVVVRLVNGEPGVLVALSAPNGRGEAGSATWSGSNYVVAWLNHERLAGCGIASCFYWSTVRVSRLTAAGELLDATGIIITPETIAADPVATAGPAGVLVSWREDGAINGARLGADGTSETPRRLIDRFSSWIGALSIAAVGTNYVATFTPYERYDVMTATITPEHIETGVPATPQALTSSPDAETNPVVVAISSTHAAVAYQRIAREPQYRNANRVFVKTFLAGEPARRRRAVGTATHALQQRGYPTTSAETDEQLLERHPHHRLGRFSSIAPGDQTESSPPRRGGEDSALCRGS